MILTINPVIDGDDTGHRSSGYESGRDGGASLLSSDPFFHQPDITFLLFIGATLGAEGSFQNVMQFDLVRDAILHVEHSEAMHLRRHAGIVQ
jgi:hypothetical protein